MALFGLFGRPKPSAFARKLSGEQEQEALDLLDEGVDVAEIAADLGVHPRTIRRLRDRKKKPKTATQAIDEMVMSYAEKALDEDPDLRQRAIESRFEKLFGSPREKPVDSYAIAQVEQWQREHQLIPTHETVLRGYRNDIEKLERRLERAHDRIEKLQDTISDLEPDENGGGLNVEAIQKLAELARDLMVSVRGGPGADGTAQLPEGQPVAALPSSGVAFATFLAGDLAFEPLQAAQMVYLKGTEGVVFNGVRLFDLIALLAADPHDAHQLVSALCSMPGGDVLRPAIERTPWLTYLPTFATSLIAWPEAGPAASPENGVVHANGVVDLQPPPGADVSPAEVLAALETLGTPELVEWALARPLAAEQLANLAGLDDKDIPGLLQQAARFGPEEWRPVAAWLRAHTTKRRALVEAVRERLAASVALSGNGTEGSLPPEDDAGA